MRILLVGAGGVGGAATVHMFTLGVADRGEPTYLGRRAVLLDELLGGQPLAL
jgi:hypothetical protein